ncbi:hypothetical protein PR202_ga11249 [Eleusine coracana subsp. coracana]|uniref:Uncharacterized protein n=1 Tax=Eleusine coracana subsp. coracana TaxID=191504 RepID=A0AAV5C8L4_ELECO|nr:hypothetical protein PR202_ga11249 [Eleusine coracana subsp. coracana]
MAGDARNSGGGGDTQVLDGGTSPLGSPVSDGGDTQSESDNDMLYCETQLMDDAETQLVDEEDEGVPADWMETQLVESGEEVGGDYCEQVETQIEVECNEEEDAGGVEDNACNGIRTQLVAECQAERGNGGVDEMLDTQLVGESEDDDGINGGDEVDVGEWGMTQLVEDSEEEAADDELSEGTEVLTDNESMSDYEQDMKSGLNGGNEGMNGRAYEHFDDKSMVDSDASTEGDADEEKQKGSNNGLHPLPKVVKSSSYNTSSRDLLDCGIDSDSHGYVQNHDKDGIKGRDKCSTAKKLFADMMAEDGENIGGCFAGLSYIGSQEPGELSQANAFEVVDRLISINGGLSSQETTPDKMEMAKPRVSNKRGTLILAEKVDLSRSSNGKTEIYEWVDSREDDGGGEFFSKHKDILLKKSPGRGIQKSHSAGEKKSSMKVASATNKFGKSKDKTNSKQCGRFEAIPLSDSRLLKNDVKSKRASGNRTKKNLLKDLDDLSNAKLFERQQEKDDVAMPDVGPDTQVAVEAMEALAQCLPAEALPANDQAPLDRMMRDAVSKTVTSQSKNGPPQKRTSSIQEGVTTRSKRRKLPESNLKPRKERLTELKMQENSELMGKTKRKQTQSLYQRRVKF